jgi:hypothetical protein
MPEMPCLATCVCAEKVRSRDWLYLGLPLIIMLGLQFIESGRQRYIKALFLTLVVMAIFSFGPKLQIAGATTDVWLPWSLARYLPMIHQALPARFSMYVALTAAVAAGLWLSAAKTAQHRVARFALAGLACLALVPSRAAFRWTPLPLQPFFEPHHVVAALGRDANVIVLPFAGGGPCMIWQWQSKMSFKQVGGYINGFIPPLEAAWPAVQSFYSGTATPNFRSDISAFCATQHVSAILVGPGTPEPLEGAVEALHWPEIRDRGMRVVRVPDLRILHYYTVSGDYWPWDQPWKADRWIGHQISIMTKGQPVEMRISGRGRPPGLGPVEINVVNGSDLSTYQVAQGDTRTIHILSDALVTVTASSTFVPDRIIHNGDQRALSVLVSLIPTVEAGGGR